MSVLYYSARNTAFLQPITGSPPTGSTARQVFSNGNVVPFQVDSDTNNIRNNLHRKQLAKNAKWSQVRLTYVNWAATSTAETSTSGTSTMPAFDLKSTIYYNGAVYPVTFAGASTYNLAPGQTIISDIIPGLTFDYTVEPYFYEACRIVGLSGTQNYPRSCVTFNIFGEAVIRGTDPLVDFTDGTLALGAKANAVVSGGNITAGTVTAGGSGYTQSAVVYAYEYGANGTQYTKNVGSATVSGGVVTGISITAGTPPSGLAAWVSPSLSVAYGSANNPASNSIPGYTFAMATGVPDRPVKSLVIIGDSITRGNGQATIPDFTMNQGIYERGVLNRCGIFNAAIGSGQAQYFAQYSTLYPKLFSLIDAADATHCFNDMGTNDIRQASQTAINTRNRILTVNAQLRNYGMAVTMGTLIPRSAAVGNDWINGAQSPVTGFALGGEADLLNADILNGTIVSDWGVVRGDLLLSADGTIQKWRTDIGTVTTDGTHPIATGVGVAGTDATFLNSFAVLA